MKQIMGYSDKISVRPGDTISFMVSCEKRASRCGIPRSIPANAGSIGAWRLPRKMASPLVRYSSSLTCRSSNRLVMDVLRPVIDARPDALDVAENFIDRIKPVIAFEHNRRRSVARERVC